MKVHWERFMNMTDYQSAKELSENSCRCIMDLISMYDNPESIEEPQLYASSLCEALDNIAWSVGALIREIKKENPRAQDVVDILIEENAPDYLSPLIEWQCGQEKHK